MYEPGGAENLRDSIFVPCTALAIEMINNLMVITAGLIIDPKNCISNLNIPCPLIAGLWVSTLLQT